MTRDVDEFPCSFESDGTLEQHSASACDETMQNSYSLVVDDDIMFAASLLLSLTNLAELKSERNSHKKGTIRSCALANKNADFFEDEDPSSKPQKKRRSNLAKVSEFTVRSCAYCKTTETPMWRHGPPGFQNLCNKV